MVLYDQNSNAILAVPLTSRNKRKLIRATRVLHSFLFDRGLTPQYQILDNECPGGLKTFLREASVKFQLVPPYLHHTNATEREIQTYKDHLISGLSSCDTNSPFVRNLSSYVRTEEFKFLSTYSTYILKLYGFHSYTVFIVLCV